MALRLAGEEGEVQGLDGAGWLREITRNTSEAALTIIQEGAGIGLQLNDILRVARDSDPSRYIELRHDGQYAMLMSSYGNIRFGSELWASNANIDLNGNLLKNAKLGTVLDANGNGISSVSNLTATTIWYPSEVYTPTGADMRIRAGQAGRKMQLYDADLDANDRGVEKAALKTCKVTADARGTPVEGDLKWDGASHKLQVYNGSAWETVTSS